MVVSVGSCRGRFGLSSIVDSGSKHTVSPVTSLLPGQFSRCPGDASDVSAVSEVR